MSDPAHEALYQQGMAHYQKREWQPALDCFRQLKAVQPSWPGLDALIDEVSWFLQLERLGADEGGEAAGPEDRTHGRSAQRRRLAWQGALLLVLLVLAAFLLWRQALPEGVEGLSEEQLALYHRGQAGLATGDYRAAQQAFAELAALAPDNPAVQEGLRRAYQLEALARAREQAKAAIEAGDWALAEARLTEILAADPADLEAGQQLAFVRRQQEAAALFAEGVAAYDARDLPLAISRLERVAALAPDYRTDTVRELLFVLYLQEGKALIARPGAGVDAIRQAQIRFGQALALRPRNVEAARESQLANQYLNAHLALERQDWNQAQSLLAGIVRQQPDYADGQAAELLYQLLVRMGDEARRSGLAAQAQRAYEQALALPSQVVLDRSAAQAGLQALQAQETPTPTPAHAFAAQPTPSVRVETATLNVRLGPGTDYPLVGQASQGSQLSLIGRNEAGDWLVVCCVNGRPGWVAARLVSVQPDGADLAALPIALAPPLSRPATPTATPTPSPTAAPPSPPPAPGANGGSASPPSPPPPPPPPPPTATPTPVPR
ncbi:MAG: SH3 domain-containing protein [Anaerolineae bacterium]|nr:SH3 domain-containing protein [Anaerolineae bacterium]